MKKRSLSILVALVMLLGMMMTGSAVAEGKVSLRWVGAGWSQNDKAKKIIDKWNAVHPEIEVQYIELGTSVDEGYLANLDTMISGGEVVDITYLTYGDVYKRVINGGALPLDAYIAKASDNYEEMYGTLSTALLTYNDEIYGVPYAGNTFKVFYNKTMTDAAGIEIPATWSIDEFTEVAIKLNDAENGVYGCVFPYTWNAICHVPAELCGWTHVKKLEDGSVVPNFDDETFKASLKWCRDLSLEHKVAPDLATMRSESINRRQTLALGKAAMIIDGPFTLVWLQNYMFNDPGEGKLPFELGVTNVPYVNETGAEVSYNTVAGAFYVPKSAAHPAEAYEFAKFVCNECPEESANYMPIYAKADMTKAVTSFTNYIDSKGNLHTDVYPVDVAIAAVATPFEAHVGKYNHDPALATYTSLMATLFGEQYALYMNDEMGLDDWVGMMQELGQAEISKAN
ncbi:MAG: ABC transporter substrate-binding protein [Christensenellales bacterium]|jgi:multiple sugar transport system substrate-binding protein